MTKDIVVWEGKNFRVTRSDDHPSCHYYNAYCRTEDPFGNEFWKPVSDDWRAQGPMPSPFVFPHRKDAGQPQLSYHGAWRTACKKAGVAKCVPYDYRRTFITDKMEKNEPGVFVAKFLDTSMQQIEKTYAKAQKLTMEGIAG
jgi:integrase